MILSLSKKGLVSINSIALTGAGFNDACIKIKASDPCVEARLDDYIKGVCSHGSLRPNPVGQPLERAAFLLHSHQKDMSSLIFKRYQSTSKIFLVF